MAFESIQDLFDRTAAEQPGEPAVDRAGDTLTYRQVEARSNRIARHLVEAGATAGTRVALLADDPFLLVPAILGVLKANAAFVPLDPEFPDLRLERMLARAAPELLLAARRESDRAARLGGGGPRVLSLGGDGEAIPLADGDAGRPELAAADPDALAYVYFTSGSSGEPKGIAGRLSGVDHFVRWEIDTLELGPGVRVSQLTTPAFDAYLRDVFVPLCCGGTVCIPADRETVLDGRRLVDWIDLEEIEVLHLVPSLFRSLLAEELKAGYFDALRWVLLAGETVLPADVEAWYGAFPGGARLVNLYGPSETTMTKFAYVTAAADGEQRIVPIGTPIRGARALLLDDGGEVCPPGSVGEIYIRTPYAAHGYLDDPEATDTAFVPNPVTGDEDDRVFRTGDMGRMLESGDYEFLGRRDQMVKVQGMRVELGEIESLLRAREGVVDAVVVDREQSTGGRTLYAYVVLGGDGAADGAAAVRDELRQALARSLPQPMLPSAIVIMDELPRTLTGKVDRKALPEPSRTGGDGAEALAPRDPVEELLAGVWRDLLRLATVGVEQSFFELGGHSLLVTQLLSRIRRAFGVTLPLDAVFEAPTIAGQAELVRELRRGGGVADRAFDLPPITPRSADGDPPPSFAQERLWVLDRLDPGNPAYNVPAAVELEGELDLRALRRGLTTVVSRHETLRTSFPAVDGRPVQRIHPPAPAALPLIDLGALPAAARDEERRRLVAEDAVARFDLQRQAPLRCRLLRLEADRHLLLATQHHICSDDWSAALLVEEWRIAYAAYAAGEEPELPPLPVQYADYAVWQRGWLEGDVLDRLVGFWRRELADAARLTELPLDRPRPARATYRGGRVPVRLGGELTAAVDALAGERGATRFMVLLAAFQTLLWRHGAQDVHAVGTPVAGRSQIELESLIGFFINNLVLRSAFSRDVTFDGYLARLRDVVLDAFSHQEMPFDKLVQELAPERDPSYAPLFQTVLALHNVEREPAGPGGGLGMRKVPVESGLVRADLDLDLIELEDGLRGNLWFNSDLFDRASAEALVERFVRLLAAVSEHPDRPLAHLPLLGDAERQQLLAGWQGETVEVGTTSFPASVAALAALHPERPAVDHVAGGEQIVLTYGELDARANRLARHLRSLGVEPGMVVGVAVERGPDLVTAFLAVQRAGGAHLPLDPTDPSERLEAMLEDAGVAVLVTSGDAGDELPVFFGFPVDLDDAAPMIEAESDAPLGNDPHPDQLAYVIFTSGSTGRPKGVLVTHRGLAHVTPLYERLGGPEERVLQFASPGFDASVAELVTALGHGGTLVTAPATDLAPGPGLLRLLDERRVTVATLPPSTLEVLPDAPLPDLGVLAAAGERCDAAVVERWGAGRAFHNLYGPTETTIWASAAECAPGGGAPTLGRPIPGVRLFLLDRRGEVVPAGVPGEIHLGGPGVVRGYLERPARTAAAFVPDPFADDPGQRLYRTGDLARWTRQGEVEFLGRIDHQVKIRGFRVELEEVEAVLAGHPAVASAAAVLRSTEDRLVAFWVADGDADATRDELVGHLARRLPRHAVPAEVVRLNEMPTTTSGKVDRQRLQRRDLGDATGGRVAHRPPQGPVEELLADIWSEVLDADGVGADSDFFDLGGYSLAGAQVLSRVEKTWGVEIPMDELFSHPTPASFAVRVQLHLDGGEGDGAPPVERLPEERRGEPAPLTFGQEVMWRRHLRDPAASDDHVHSLLRLRGELDVDALTVALSAVEERHQVLRTAFRPAREGPVQEVGEPRSEPLAVEDLSAVAADERKVLLDEALLEEAVRPFDLTDGRPWRARLFRLADDDHVLALVWHHAVSDPWSATLFSHELSVLYRRRAVGAALELPELPVQVVDYAHWQRRWAESDACGRQIDFWRRRLEGAEPPRLPLDTGGHGASGPMGRVRGELAAPRFAELRRVGREAGATPFMVFLALFAVLLRYLTGQDDMVVWSPVGQRPRPEVEPLIGFFPHSTLLRLRLDPASRFDDLLTAVRDTALEAYGRQDVPFELLRRHLENGEGGADLLRVSSNYLRLGGAGVTLPGLEATAYELAVERHMDGDLELLLRERADDLAYDLNYRADRLERATVEAWSRRLESLAAAVAENPAATVEDLLRRIGATREVAAGSVGAGVSRAGMV